MEEKERILGINKKKNKKKRTPSFLFHFIPMDSDFMEGKDRDKSESVEGRETKKERRQNREINKKVTEGGDLKQRK